MRKLLLFCIIFIACKVSATELVEKLHGSVQQAIEHAKEIPGLKAEEFQAIKGQVLKTMDTLVTTGVIEVEGSDKEVRPSFVALQGVIEYVLAHELKKEVSSLKGFIHTPMPATPLCSKGEISPELVDPSIAEDPNRLFTIAARTTIVRDFLHQGGLLFIAYPKEGISKRTEEQQQIYRGELTKYPQNLFDRPLEVANIPDELIGATYLFTDKNGTSYAFAIKMTQAKDPKANGKFGLWFGPLTNTNVAKRYSSVFNFLRLHGV